MTDPVTAANRWGGVAVRVLVGVIAGVLLTGCASRPVTSPTSGATPTTGATAAALAVGGMTGPTGMGLAPLMAGQGTSTAGPAIAVTLYPSADQITPQLVNGSLPLATVPVNLAAVLYAKTKGAVQLAAVNTLGVLYVVAKGSAATSVRSVADLAGKTVWSTGQGTTPQYVMDDLLTQAGVSGTVDVQYLSAASEVAARLVAADSGIAVLPEPYVTTVMAKDKGIEPVIDLTQAWAAVHSTSPLVTGALVVQRAWADAHPDLYAGFLQQYRASIQFAIDHPDEAGPMIAAAGIVPDAATAAAALPRCHLTYLDGSDARTAVSSYLQVLFAANPQSVGGALPGDDFYRPVTG